VSFEQPFQDGDGTDEVVAERHHQVDVVKILRAPEGMGQIVPGIDGGLHLAAVRAGEAEESLAPFRRRPVGTQGGEGDGHRQVVAKAAKAIGGAKANLILDKRSLIV
jgi:hypothetical protein